MRKALVGAAALAVIATASVVWVWAGGRNAEKPATSSAAKAGPAPAGVVIEAAKVSVVRLPQALGAVGSLRSDETVIVRPEVAGRVAQILFREGERVTKGQVLVKLDDSVQQADLDRT